MLCMVKRLQLHLTRNDYMRKYTNAAVISPKGRLSYSELIQSRQIEAKRTVVVQVSSEQSYLELKNYCKTYGNIKSAHHYKVQHEDDHHYILLEFSSIDEASAVIFDSTHNAEYTGVPVQSPFLWFKATGKHQFVKNELAVHQLGLNIIDGSRSIDNERLNNLLLSATSIEEQVKLLYQQTKLNDIGVRLRFLAALQVQCAVSGMFPYANAQPFGSSVNGFGRMGCDLDLILRLDKEFLGKPNSIRPDSRLVFHTKENLSNGRSQIQRQMETVGDMLHLFLPGVIHVRRILQARVPIIKYHQEHLNLEVDLSMNNLTGFYMSELLFMFGELDDRVRPLMFCLRRWANSCGLTNPSPGRWITNFSLACLVIFFLQNLKQPVLPTINTLFKSASQQDIRITEDGINCSFTRDFKRTGFDNKNGSQINELLLQFFEFYSKFDFHNRAISLNEGRDLPKPDHSALYIINPLEQMLNVSKNVSLEECERLRIEVRNGAWLLESEIEYSAIQKTDRYLAPWGILNLFKSNENAITRSNFFFKPRMMEIKDLFHSADFDNSSQAVCNKNTEFKNLILEKHVQNIRTEARSELKQLHSNTETSRSVRMPTTTPIKEALQRKRSR